MGSHERLFGLIDSGNFHDALGYLRSTFFESMSIDSEWSDKESGNSIQHMTVLRGAPVNDEDALTLIQEMTFDPNVGNADAETPLMLACKIGNFRWMRALLSVANTDAEIKDARGLRAVDHACLAGSQEIFNFLADESPFDPSLVREPRFRGMIKDHELFEIMLRRPAKRKLVELN